MAIGHTRPWEEYGILWHDDIYLPTYNSLSSFFMCNDNRNDKHKSQNVPIKWNLYDRYEAIIFHYPSSLLLMNQILGIDNIFSNGRKSWKICTYILHCWCIHHDISSSTQYFTPIYIIFSSLRQSDVYIRQWHEPLSVRIVAGRVFDAKALSQPILMYWQLDS